MNLLKWLSRPIPWTTLLLLVLASWGIGVTWSVAGCSGTGPKVAISAADIVNEVARRGDQTYAVSVEACHAAEMVAAEQPNVDEAERAVGRIRAACDHAFHALDEVRLAIARVDEAMARAEAGQLPIRDVVSAALSARELFESAQAEQVTLTTQLQKGGP